MSWLVVGLGNPEVCHAENRHNIGFMVVDECLRRVGMCTREKFKAQYTKTAFGGQDVVFMKPMTYMNRSGIAVGLAGSFYKVAEENVIVVHDELDLAFGKLQVKAGGGHAGHNGLRSIFSHFGKDFIRLRCGIGRPERKEQVSGYVLSDFGRDESSLLTKFVDNAADSLDSVLRFGTKEAMRTISASTLN
jgi:PTH1 family peptidyl-tRNA hydrolase